jgi:hypothetical protein
MSKTFELLDTDKGWKELRKLFREHSSKASGIEFGITDKYGADVPKYALVHEYGAPSQGIPERSYIRATLDTNKEKYRKIIRGLVIQAIAQAQHGEEADISGGLEQLGRLVVADMKARIKSNIPPPLKPATLRRKRAKGLPETALMGETGRLIKSIVSRVMHK